MTRCGSIGCAAGSGRRRLQLGDLGGDAIGPQPVEQIELALPRGPRATIGQVHDLALLGPVDRAVRLFDEAGQSFREPVIAPRLPGIAVHALLHHDPLAVCR